MCDTFYRRTLNKTIFAKNSDRSANEPNLCLFYPPLEGDENRQCTYIGVGNVGPIRSVLLVQPSWMWGGEMGINDRGVVIGNEAVFTKSKGKKENKLIGMDLLRLALEQSSSAQEAVDVIIKYLQEFGQGGNSGFDKHFYYDNSYLIADGKEAFILETAGKNWALKKVHDFGAISNRLFLNRDYDQASKPGIDFAKTHTEPVFSYFSQAKVRRSCVIKEIDREEFGVESAIETLSMHHPDDEKNLYKKGSVRSVCMHQSLLGDHTTGSMIVDFQVPYPTIWLTGSGSPCLSLFKPCFFGIVQPPIFADKEAALSYWLEHEYLNRAVFANLIDKTEYLRKRDLLQKEFIEEEAKLRAQNPSLKDLEEFAKSCFEKEQKWLREYQTEIQAVKNQTVKMPKIWAKKTKVLGRKVFETDYDKRNNR